MLKYYGSKFIATPNRFYLQGSDIESRSCLQVMCFSTEWTVWWTNLCFSLELSTESAVWWRDGCERG